MNNKTGVGLFAYNRPSHFKRVLISLESYNINNLNIFIDGPKNKKDKINQDYIIFMIKNSTLKDYKIYKRRKNLGLSNSLISGINILSKNYDQFIVLEDDCIPYPYFFEYFKYCFNKFNNDEKVNSICSFQFQEFNFKSTFNLQLMKLPHFIPWGWGTWSHKWKKPGQMVEKCANLQNEYVLAKISLDTAENETSIFLI